MKRTEFIRTTSESVGISSQVVLDFLNTMDDGHTEMHSLMIMHQDKIIGEGWWSPYAPGIRHTMMSTSKTFTATAIGLAIDEGILNIDEKIVDIFPEYVPNDASDYLKKITIYHLLTMSSGMEEACVVDENYISNFMNTPVLHKPGTDFFYNDSAVTLLPAILYKKTGIKMIDYLKPRLFDKIGIDYKNITWFNIATGTEFGAGGLFCTTEDALRLMKLYKDQGVWEGQQVLSKAFVQEATRKQILTDTNTPRTHLLPKDNRYGYGYLMWMGKESYRSEGAYGQITIVVPKKDLIISFTEANYSKDPASQESMDRCNVFIDNINVGDPLLENKQVYTQLQNRFNTLALARPPYQPYGSFPNPRKWYQAETGIHPENLFYAQLYSHPMSKNTSGITAFCIEQKEAHLVEMQVILNNENRTLLIPTDGSRLLHRIHEYYKSMVYLSGYWKDKESFAIRFRWIETVFEKELVFRFKEDKCFITEKLVHDVRNQEEKHSQAFIKE